MINIHYRENRRGDDKYETLVEAVACDSLDVELIKKQRLSRELKELLITKNQKNQLNSDKEFIFYTDGSLKKIVAKNNLDYDRMGAGWLQVDTKEERVVDEGAVGARNWPSSTKSELLAIWLVLLIAPKKRRVKIYTDSAVAISGINRGKKLKTSRQ